LKIFSVSVVAIFGTIYKLSRFFHEFFQFRCLILSHCLLSLNFFDRRETMYYVNGITNSALLLRFFLQLLYQARFFVVVVVVVVVLLFFIF
jgi:hypothetical protein